MRPFAAKIGVVASALSNDPRSAPKLSRPLGFTGLLFDAYSASLNIPELSTSGRRDFRHMLSSQDQHLIGLAADAGAKGLAPGADVDRFLDRIEQAMEAAAALGARLVCVDLGPLPPPPRQERLKPKISPDQAGLIIIPTPRQEVVAAPPPGETGPADVAFVNQVKSVLTELCRRADRYSATVAFRSDLASLASLEHALLNADCPHFGVDLDPVALLRDEWSIDETFSQLGPLVHHVRVRDALSGQGHRTRSTPVGSGSVDWTELISALDEATYQGWLTLDPTDLPDRASAAASGGNHLRKLLQA